MLIKLFSRFTITTVLIGSVAWGRIGVAVAGEPAVSTPPVEVLQANFDHASHVLEIEVEEVREVESIRSDSEEIGYIQYSVTGTVLDVLKSSEGMEIGSGGVEYRFTQEYDPGGAAVVSTGSRYLVFLKLVEDPPRFWVVGNGAQFELTPALSKTVQEISKGK